MLATDCPNLLAQAATHLDSTTWIALLLGVCATAYVMVRAKRPKKDPLERSPISSGLAQQRSVERQMSNLLIELTEMSRTISAGLDTRAAKLHALLDESDRKIAELRALNSNFNSQSHSRSNSDSSVISGSIIDPPESMHQQPDARHAEVYALADRGRGVQQIAAELGRPSGEIELILALRPRAASHGPVATQS